MSRKAISSRDERISSVCSATVTFDATYTITAVANTGYQVQAWGGNCSGSARERSGEAWLRRWNLHEAQWDLR